MCGHGDLLQIECFAPWIRLMHDGGFHVEYVAGTERWDRDSQACCANCQWKGYVRDLLL